MQLSCNDPFSVRLQSKVGQYHIRSALNAFVWT